MIGSECVSVAVERSPAQLVVLTWIVLLEAAVLAAGTLFLAWEVFVGDAQDLRSAIALTVTTALLTIGVAVVGVGLARRWARIRGGVLLWQILQIALSIGAFQGLLGPAWIGWLLLVPAGVAIWLLFTKPVTAVFQARDAERR